jgi:Fe2+ or Zn2+ uptake regulation protein
MEIFREVTSSCCHPTAEVVWKALHGAMPGLSRDTVYRTLETLGRLGVISRLPLDAEAVRFDGNPEEHHHLVCRRCGRIDDLYWPELERVKPPGKIESWGQIDRKTVLFSGVCKGCAGRKANSRPDRRASHRL